MKPRLPKEDLVALARQLRRARTDAERKLWRELREVNRNGFHFRQQAPIGGYIVDFADHAAKLVIEVDGGQHADEPQVSADVRRTEWLESQGYRVLRFWNGDVLRNIDGAMTMILGALGVIEEPAPKSVSQEGND